MSSALTTRPFEDIPVDHDWPKDLRALHRAANEAWSLYSNLEDAMKARTPANARGVLHILAGSAYTLLNDLRGAGISSIWEYERQRAFAEAAKAAQYDHDKNHDVDERERQYEAEQNAANEQN